MTNDDWNYVGGCGVLHPFNPEKRAACEASRLAKKAANPRNADEQADLILAQAAADKVNQPSTSWTPGQILMVTGGSVILLTIMIVVIKKATTKK